MNEEQILDGMSQWVYDNLLTKQGAIAITGQSVQGINQSIYGGKLKPFVTLPGRPGGYNNTGQVRLFLKSDVEEYAEKMRKRRT